MLHPVTFGPHDDSGSPLAELILHPVFGKHNEKLTTIASQDWWLAAKAGTLQGMVARRKLRAWGMARIPLRHPDKHVQDSNIERSDAGYLFINLCSGPAGSRVAT
jgi:hypothetical protein